MKLKLNWESALLALLIAEILLFGALNPRMLDLNMLLFSTSDFICIGIVALPWLASATLLPGQKQKPVWDRRALLPFLMAGTFETLGIVLVIAALSVGQVVVVSPIIATSPLWITLGTWLFLRDIEKLTLRTVLGAACVVAGTIAISLAR